MEALEVLRQCFPESGGTPVTYVAVAGRRGLRWILPAQSQRITGLMAAWRPYSFPARLGWGLMRLAAKGGLLPRLPGAQLFEADIPAEKWREFGWMQKKPPLILAYVGTPGPHRKLVITLADPQDGKGHLVIKRPLSDTAWCKIKHEYSSLNALKSDGRKIAPEPILINHLKRFTVQTYLQGLPTEVTLTDGHYRFLANLYQYEDTLSLASIAENIITRREKLLKKTNSRENDIAQLNALLGERFWHGNVRSVVLHGDFAPWNLKWNKEGMIGAVDWEEYQAAGLPFYDLHCYEMRARRLLGKRTSIDWRQYAFALADAGYPATDLEQPRIWHAAGALALITMLEQENATV